MQFCTAYMVLMMVVFIICTGIRAYFVYCNWSLVKNVSRNEFGTVLRQQFSKLMNGKSQTN